MASFGDGLRLGFNGGVKAKSEGKVEKCRCYIHENLSIFQ